jgi:hypothetical protein
MRKLIQIIIILFGIILNNKAQVFNSDVILKKSGMFLGVEPVVITPGNNFMVFIDGGYGIKSGINLDLKGGFGGGGYFGADLKWALFNHVSLNTGLLYTNNVMGLNGCLNFSIPIHSSIRILTGAHLNVDFDKSKVQTPFWIPVGVDIGLRKYMGLILEGEIGLNGAASSLFGGGLAFYF